MMRTLTDVRVGKSTDGGMGHIYLEFDGHLTTSIKFTVGMSAVDFLREMVEAHRFMWQQTRNPNQ